MPLDEEAWAWYGSLENGQEVEIEVKTKHRTAKQNNAMWLYCSRLAKDLRDAGFDMRDVLKPGVPIPPTKEMIMDRIWKPVMKAMFDIESTQDLDTKQVNEVYQVISQRMAEKFGLITEFPHHGD